MKKFFYDTEDGAKPFEKTGTTWANVCALSNILHLKKDYPQLDPVGLWCRLRQKEKITLSDESIELPRLKVDMVDRISWIADEQRLDDLGMRTLQEFRLSAARNEPFSENPHLNHLPENRLIDLREIVSRTPDTGKVGTRLLDTDQSAVIFHITRLNGSMKACREIFNEPVNNSAVNYTRMLTRAHMTYNPERGWNWGY